MIKKYDSYILDDDKEFVVVDTATIDGTSYVCFANCEDEKDIIFKKVIIKDNEEYLTGLENKNEFDKVLLYFTKKNLE